MTLCAAARARRNQRTLDLIRPLPERSLSARHVAGLPGGRGRDVGRPGQRTGSPFGSAANVAALTVKTFGILPPLSRFSADIEVTCRNVPFWAAM